MPDSHILGDVSLFDPLSKVFAPAIALLYLSGFIVVATYLSGYGVSSFDVLHLQYLIAGIWALGPPVLLGSMHQIQDRFQERAAPEVAGKFNWRRYRVAALFGLPATIFVGLLATIPNVSEHMTWGIGIRLMLFYVGMWGGAQLLWV